MAVFSQAQIIQIMKTTLKFKYSVLLLGSLALSSLAGASENSSPVLEIEPINSNSVRLSWTPYTGADWMGYRIDYRSDLEAEWAPASGTDWPITETTWEAVIDSETAGYFRVVALTGSPVNRGELIGATLIRSMSIAQVQDVFTSNTIPILASNGVDLWKLEYQTPDATGAPVTASGLLAVPQGIESPAPMLSYQHGTLHKWDEAPSMAETLDFTATLAMASTGYIAQAPDYLGFGSSRGLHPYVHAATEASAVIDMLRATRTYMDQQSIAWNEQLFLVGYSQGGHATMAAHRELESNHADEFTVTASAPMAGPYDMSGTMFDLLLSNEPYDSPNYLPYLLFGYDLVYDWFGSPKDVFIEPYNETLPPLFDGESTGGQIDAVLPDVPRDILQPALLEKIESNDEHPWRLILRENDVYDWTPRAPIQMYHCAGDTTVPRENSTVALARFNELGAESVELIDPFPLAGHAECAPFSLLRARTWFESLRQ